MSLTVGSLFAGIGGFDLGFERAGMLCRWQVEIDERCRQVLARHWPDVPRYGDVKDVGRKQLEPVDVICGGFPCQPFSIQGEQRGEQDSRNLWPEFARIISEIKPRWVVAENVSGLLSIDSGRYFGEILGALSRMGYDAEWRIIEPWWLGINQDRKRLFILAYFNRGQRKITHERAWLHFQGQAIPIRRGQPTPFRVRVDNGIPDRLDIGKRITMCSNAVVPQIAEWIGRRIIELDSYTNGSNLSLNGKQLVNTDNPEVCQSVTIGTQNNTVLD